MMPLWLILGFCTLAWSSGAFFGAGVFGHRATASATTHRTEAGRPHRSKRETTERLRKSAWQVAGLGILAVLVWLIASLTFTPGSFIQWLQNPSA